MHRVLAIVAKENQHFLGHGPAFSPLLIGACFSFFFFAKSSIQAAERRISQTQHIPIPLLISSKFGRLIFSCDAHPIGEHEVQ